MRVLITWGSKRGGTEGIAATIAQAMRVEGIDVDMCAASRLPHANEYDAVLVGGALYAGRWHRAALRFVRRRQAELRCVPVWFFSSGPLDASADTDEIPPVPQVAVLMERVGAQGHVTFGGRLTADAKGFPAAAIAKKHAGDHRNPTRIAAWARQVCDALPSAKPGTVVAQPGGSVGRVLAHAVIGWAMCAATMGALLSFASKPVALAAHAVLAPVYFFVIAAHYFRLRGARGSLETALSFVGVVMALDALIVARLLLHSFAMFASIAGTWLPFALIFGVTWAVGELHWMGAPKRPAGGRATMA